MFTPSQSQHTPRAASRALTANHSRAVSRALNAYNCRAVSRALNAYSRAVTVASHESLSSRSW
jgi:hypothetical protein